MTSIGILGNGVVGKATGDVLESKGFTVKRYDVEPSRSTHERSEVNACDWILLCVQTTSEPEKALGLLRFASRDVRPWKLVIRSTLMPSMLDKIVPEEEHQLVWPEFLTARTAAADSRNPNRLVIGGKHWVRFYNQVLNVTWPGVRTFTFEDAKEACLVKLASNGFSAVKVLYWNLIKMLSGESYDKVLSACLASGWINPMHTQVPGPDGKLGFGGACLPKDLELLAQELTAQGQDSASEFLDWAGYVNKKIRGIL